MNRRDIIKTLGIAAMIPVLQNFTVFDDHQIEYLESPEALTPIKPGKALTGIVIGAGQRGSVYSRYSSLFPGDLQITGVAEPIKIKQKRFKELFNIPENQIFDTWEHVFQRPKFADFCIITTPDHLHYGPAMKALEMGYHLILEKPIAQSWKECNDILKMAKKNKRIVAICHVLRYAPFFKKIHDVVQSGEIGDVVSIQHLEPIGNIHFSHSYVRGNWRNMEESTPTLLSKSCHDLDIIRWILDKSCKKVTSFGGLRYFRESNAPEGSTIRCTDGCKIESTCPYSALRIYLRNKLWGIGHVLDVPPYTDEKVLQALKTGPYGKCVFRNDNTAVDHQIINMEFEDEVTVAFSMECHTSYMGRRTRIMGTKGDLVGDERELHVSNFSARKSISYKSEELNDDFNGGGHGGGDLRLVKDFLNAVVHDDESLLTSTIEASMESHLIGFKAEESRNEGGRIKRTIL